MAVSARHLRRVQSGKLFRSNAVVLHTHLGPAGDSVPVVLAVLREREGCVSRCASDVVLRDHRSGDPAAVAGISPACLRASDSAPGPVARSTLVLLVAHPFCAVDQPSRIFLLWNRRADGFADLRFDSSECRLAGLPSASWQRPPNASLGFGAVAARAFRESGRVALNRVPSADNV